MNKVLLVVCLAALICSAATSVNASPDSNWLIYFSAYNAAGTGIGSASARFGTGLSFSDGLGPFEDVIVQSILNTMAAIYCTDLDPSKYWIADRRQSATNAAKIWNLKLQIGTSFPDSQALIKAWIQNSPTDSFQPSSDWSLTLQRKSGSNWEIVHVFNGNTGSETYPVFSTLVDVTNGATYDYRLVYAPVPEPSSILALIAGLGTLGSITWHRRK